MKKEKNTNDDLPLADLTHLVVSFSMVVDYLLLGIMFSNTTLTTNKINYRTTFFCNPKTLIFQPKARLLVI